MGPSTPRYHIKISNGEYPSKVPSETTCAATRVKSEREEKDHQLQRRISDTRVAEPPSHPFLV